MKTDQAVRAVLHILETERDTAIQDAVDAAVEPLRAEVDALRAEVAQLRQGLQSRDEPKVYVSVSEAAHRLGLCTRTIRRRIDAGELPTVRIGRIIRIPVAALVGIELPDAAE